MVVPVVDLFAIGTESANALALVLAALLFVGIFHRYSHAYV
ncbi:MAG: hypothetical protein WBI82_00315 [Sphaerochaeta sp.]